MIPAIVGYFSAFGSLNGAAGSGSAGASAAGAESGGIRGIIASNIARTFRIFYWA